MNQDPFKRTARERFCDTSRRPCLLLALLWALLGSTLSTRADTTILSGAIEITALPCPINAPGVYFLNRNFDLNTAAGNGITVNADGVTIDLNGHTISNSLAGAGVTGAGIYANGITRLTVRNGIIRGFACGILVDDTSSDSALIENMCCLQSTYTGVLLCGSGSIIRHCGAFKIGGSTQPSMPHGVGFWIVGNNNTVQDCDVSELTRSTASDASVGIYVQGGQGFLLLGNRTNGVHYGIYFDNAATGKYRDNLCAASVTTPYTGGTDVGNN